MDNAAAPKITTRSFVFQHADSGNCQKSNPKRVCGRPVIIKNRANGEPVSFQCRSALLVSHAMKTIALASSSERPRRPIGTPVTRAALFSGVPVKRVNKPSAHDRVGQGWPAGQPAAVRQRYCRGQSLGGAPAQECA